MVVSPDLSAGLRADVNEADLADFFTHLGQGDAAVRAGDAVVSVQAVFADLRAQGVAAGA